MRIFNLHLKNDIAIPGGARKSVISNPEEESLESEADTSRSRDSNYDGYKNSILFRSKNIANRNRDRGSVMNGMYLNIPEFNSIKIDPKLKWDVDIAKLKNPDTQVLTRSTSVVPVDKKKFERQENIEKASKIATHNTSNLILSKINENFRYRPIGSLGKQKNLSYGRNGSPIGSRQTSGSPEPDSGFHYYDPDYPESRIRHRGAVMFDQDYL
jgi:hypothetical protein